MPGRDGVAGGLALSGAGAWRIPSGATLGADGHTRFRLKETRAVQRIAFEPDAPIALDGFASLRFGLGLPERPDWRPSILTGDTAMPEVRLTNARGVTYRFRRGNLKDFFDILRPHETQPVELPLNAFTYDTDVRQNARETAAFADSPIVRIDFDFLADPAQAFDVVFEAPTLVPAGADAGFVHSIFDLVEITNHSNFSEFPRFLTEMEVTTFRVQLSRIGARLHPGGLHLTWSILRPDGEPYERTTDAGRLPAYAIIHTEQLGVYETRLRLTDRATGALVAETPTTLVRSVSTPPGTLSKLGISDGAGYERVARYAGRFQRRPIGLNIFNVWDRGDRLDVRMKRGGDGLPLVRDAAGGELMVSAKILPQALSSAPDRPDFDRYPPADLARMGEFLRHVRDYVASRGVHYYEVWNEASVRHEWLGSMNDLIDLHRVTAEVFAGSGIKVLGCGTHAIDHGFIDRFLNAGGWRHCDGLSLHAYTYEPEGFHADLLRVIDRLKAEEQAEGTAMPPLYFTETGFRTPAFTERQQAEFLSYFSVVCHAYERVKSFLWFRFQNHAPEDPGTYDQTRSAGYAMVGHDDTYVRPSLAAYRYVNALMAATRFVALETSGDTERIGFASESGRLEVVCNPTLLPGLPEPAPGLTPTDVFGRPLSGEEAGAQRIRFDVSGRLEEGRLA